MGVTFVLGSKPISLWPMSPSLGFCPVAAGDCVSFDGICPSAAAEVLHALRGIRSVGAVRVSHGFRGVRPAGVADACMPFMESALAPPPRSRVPFAGYAPMKRFPFAGSALLRQPVHQKQKSRHFCNFFAIRDSFLFPQSGNRLPNGRLPALLHRDLRSGESITIPNRKKVAIRADFLFSVPLPTALGWCRGRGDSGAAPRDGPDAVAQARHRETVRAHSMPTLRDESGAVLRDSLGAALGRHWDYGRGGPGTAHGIPSDALRHSGVVCMTTLRANAECRTEATENPHRVRVRD